MDWLPLIRAARGVVPADLVLRNGRVVNVFTSEVERVDVAMAGGYIVGLGPYEGRTSVDLEGRFVSPGLIDPHLHLESSMLTPAELARAVLPCGTTALVADPHEIANVLGLRGVRLLMQMTENLPVDVFFTAPSCVPATDLETAGAELPAEALRELLDDPRVLGLAEMMNYPGVINGDPGVMAKIEAFQGKFLDGHAPLLGGGDLAAYLVPGIATEHEATDPGEAWEKLARGMRIFIREGSQAKNLEDLLPLATERNLRRLAFCTDDRHPEGLIREGHLDHILRRAVSRGLDPIKALIMATINPAETYGLRRRGALAPGYIADAVVFDDLESFVVHRVYKNGLEAARDGAMSVEVKGTPIPEWSGPMNVKGLSAESLRQSADGPLARVIGLIEGQLLTEALLEDTPQRGGWVAAEPSRDLLRLAVVERHKGTGNIGLGLVKGFGIKWGALASSVAHDSHNIIAVGASDEDLLAAIRAVIEMRGGQAAAAGGEIMARLPLPLAGLMSEGTAAETAAKVRILNEAAADFGCWLKEPFMALSFLALPVIPHLRLTDKGLVDVDRFELTGLFE